MKRIGEKKSVALVLLFFMIFNLVPGEIARASENENILSEAFLTSEEAKKWARQKGATETFISLADLYWRYHSGRGNVNPAIAYVQAAKETGYGKFGGVIDESYNNPCGLKVSAGGDDKDPNAHHRFNNWDEGVQAHLDHLALYAGASNYPRSDTYDPRHFSSIVGKAKTVIELGGAWAPSPSYGIDIMRMYNELKQSIPPKDRRTVIDNLYQQGNDNIYICGWALNPSGINKVKIYIDEKYIADAEIGVERLDVNNIYPGYPGGKNSGYNKTINLSEVQAGRKKITIEALGKDGSSDKVETYINVSKKKAMTVMETPVSGSEVSGNKLYVSGWALNPSGVKVVKIYADGKYLGDANIGGERPDVNNIYPGYPNGKKSGYSKEIDLGNLGSGNKVIKIEAIGNDGSKDIIENNINITKKRAITVMDTPNNGAEVRGDNLYISGWALNPSGIKTVKIYVNGVYMGTSNIDGERPDVNNVYPGYPGGEKSGYSKEIDLKNIGAGNKTIKAEAIGNDGSIDIVETSISIIKKKAITVIETPNSGAEIREKTVYVSGWALNPSGIKEVKLSIGGKFIENANIGIGRVDVNNAYPGYPGGENSGYNKEINLNNVGSGKQVLKVEVIGKDGSIDIAEHVINIVAKKPITVIDTPWNKSEIKEKNVYVSGWALNSSGVKEIKLYIDGKYKGNANVGIERLDVNNAYPEYLGGKNSGYNKEINLDDIESGNRILTVESIGNDGTISKAESAIHVIKKKPITVVETPVNGSSINENKVYISGWALNPNGIKEVKVYVNGRLRGNANIGIERTDVNNIYPGYIDGKNSGYNAEITMDKEKNEISIQAVGKDNSITTENIVVYNKQLIVIDPGHSIKSLYDVDTGASQTHNGVVYKEEVLNMQVALKLRDELNKLGYKVLLTQEPNFVSTDKNVRDSLERRVSFANSNEATLMVSIHHNSGPATAKGTETYYSSVRGSNINFGNIEKNKKLATSVSKAIANGGNYVNRGSKDNEFYVIKNTKMYSILSEVAFISNQSDAIKAANQGIQLNVAREMAKAIDEFLKNN